VLVIQHQLFFYVDITIDRLLKRKRIICVPNETWEAGSKMTTYHIDDLKNLSEDIEEHQAQATQAYYAVIGLIASLNTTKKLI